MTDSVVTNWTRSDEARIADAVRRGASRRELLRGLALSGVALGAGGAILGRAGAAVAQTPRSGGALRAAGWSSSTADTLDPAKASHSADYSRCCAFYNRLTVLDARGDVQMELAESIESRDARTWTVRLRKDVTFHDGKGLTAADVIYSLQRHADPLVGSKVNALAKQMTGFRAPDDRTVEITLANPNADLPTILAMHHFMIVADGTRSFAKANGTGAFTCEVFEPGVRSVGLKNRNYWKPGAPYLDSFEFIAISDNTARVNALLAGDIQLAGAIDPRSIRFVESRPGVTFTKSNAGNYTNLSMRLDMAPGDKAGFVEGMKHLLNRELIQKSALRGLAEIGNDQPVPPSNKYFNPEVKPRAFDPEKAKALFAKAGLTGQTIPVVASDAAPSSVDMAVILQQAAATIGLTLDLQRMPSDGYWSNYWLKSPVCFGNINPRPTPDILFSLFYASSAPWNETRYKSETFDRLLVEARGLLDEGKRKQIYGDMQAMIADEAGSGIPVFISNVDAHASKLKGLQANPLGAMMGFAFAEHVWLEA
ncbi:MULTISPECIES: ABC transporter substrate-binding protein [Methylobacterium]|uniref:ABC transporter substrate-binding protein n=1 Tax=Methylobacterium TaxID=407 RepID=UPI0013E9E92D|nr:ABC transporter substrate-binding protein [Methylobacterium sp. DB0501]NGM38140.1 ABC transporter substrate-binding protein [Methylobacterium sp. DB0501]